MRQLKITRSITLRDEKSLEKYLTEVSKYDVLTPEQEVECFQQLKAGEKSVLDKIISHNLRFVISVAKQYQNMGLGLGDLISEGNLGLIKAANRFDETRGFKFISYAVWWIRQSVISAINEKSKKIRMPANTRGNAMNIMKFKSAFAQKEEREPSVDEIAIEMNLLPDDVEKYLIFYQKCASLDAPINGEGDNSLANILEDNSFYLAPDHKLNVEESRQYEVAQLLKKLPARQSLVLSMYYGIGQENPSSFQDIGDAIGVSRERVRQLKDQAMNKLRRQKIY